MANSPKYPTDFPKDHRPRGRRRGAGRAAVLAAGALAVTLAVSGCAAGKATTAGSGGSMPTVKIGKAVDSVGFAVIDVAQSLGYFKDEGVNVTSSVLSGSAVAYSALQGGSIQFAAASAPAMLPAAGKGVPLYSIISLDYGNPQQLLVSKKWASAHNMTPENQQAGTVMKSLKGAKLASISTSNTQAYGYLWGLAGLQKSDFQVITVDSVNAVLAGLQHGQFDAFLVPPPTSIKAQADGIGIIVPSLKSVPEVANSMFDVITTTKAYADKNKKAVTAVATALARAENEMATHPEKVLPILKKHYPAMSDQVLADSLKYLTFAEDGQQTQARWEAANTLLDKTGGKSTSLDFSEDGPVWTNKYIDKSRLAG